MDRLFRWTIKLQSFDEPLETNQDTLFKNQYPENWIEKIANDTLETLVEGKHKASQEKKKIYNTGEKRSPLFWFNTGAK